MNASDRRLSFARIGRLWAAETDSPGVVAEDITSDLIDAALDSEFEFDPENNRREPDGSTPANYDLRLGKLVETFDRAGQPIYKHKLQNFIDAAKKGFGASEKAARRDIADDILLSVLGLRRWCSRPEFSEWASSRGLSPPAFIGSTVRGTGDNAKSPRPRKRKAEVDALVTNRIRAVFAKRNRKWSDPDKRPTVDQMARILTENRKPEDYSFETVRKILSGAYPSIKRLNIDPT